MQVKFSIRILRIEAILTLRRYIYINNNNNKGCGYVDKWLKLLAYMKKLSTIVVDKLWISR